MVDHEETDFTRRQIKKSHVINQLLVIHWRKYTDTIINFVIHFYQEQYYIRTLLFWNNEWFKTNNLLILQLSKWVREKQEA